MATVSYSLVRAPDESYTGTPPGIVQFSDGSIAAWHFSEAQLTNGNFVQEIYSPSGIGWQVLDPALTPLANGSVGTTGEHPDAVDALAGASSRFIIAGGAHTNNGDIMIHLRAADGSDPIDFAVDSSAAFDRNSMVAPLADGGFAVAWQRTIGGVPQAWYAVYDADGSVRLPPTFLANLAAGTSPSDMRGLASGGFAVAYGNNVALLDAAGAVQHTVTVPAAEGLLTLSNGYLLVTSRSPDVLDSNFIDPTTGELLSGSPSPVSIITDPNGVIGGFDVTGGGSRDVAIAYTDQGDTYTLDYALRYDVARTTVGTVADEVLGGDGFIDVMRGLGGDDSLNGAAGDDVLEGGDGDDDLSGGTGDDTLTGGAGVDTADYSGFAGALSVNLSQTSAQDTGAAGVDTISTVENLISGLGDDRLIGSTGENAIHAGDGGDIVAGLGRADVLFGQGGNDTLIGGAGDDRLAGGLGRDVLAGDADGDTFIFATLADSMVGTQRDLIADFTQGADLIDLTGIEDQTGQALAFIGDAPFSGTAGQLRSFFTSTQTILEGDTNGDGTADFQIALKGNLTLHSGDFAL